MNQFFQHFLKNDAKGHLLFFGDGCHNLLGYFNVKVVVLFGIGPAYPGQFNKRGPAICDAGFTP